MIRPFVIASFAVSLAGVALVYGPELFVAGAASVALPACNTTDAGLYTPITGIQILADNVTAGHGCGADSDAGQIFKYAAVVYTAPEGGTPSFAASGVFDCFTDATFVNLCTQANANGLFTLNLYALTSEAWSEATLDPNSPLVAQASTSLPKFDTYPSPDCVDGAAQPSPPPDSLLTPYASFESTCTALQQSDIPVVATCAPLKAVAR